MPLCKPHITTDSQKFCAFCGHCEKQDGKKVTCPYEDTAEFGWSFYSSVGLACLAIGIIGLMMLAVCARMGWL